MAGARQKTCFDNSAPGFSGVRVLITESSFLILSPSTVTFTSKGMVSQVDGGQVDHDKSI